MKYKWDAKILGICAVIAVMGVALVPSARAMETASESVSGQASAVDTSWRSASTQPFADKSLSPTSASREQTMKNQSKYMEDFILNYRGEYGVGDIPPMEFLFAEGSHYNTISTSYGVGGRITRFSVTNLKSKAGKVKGTLLLPVSGHQGNVNARRWAVTDFYQVRLDTNPNNTPSTHSSWGRTGHETLLVRSKSLDLVTKQEVELQLIPNIPLVVLYEREGSAGIGGYVEGRVMEFIWDGK